MPALLHQQGRVYTNPLKPDTTTTLPEPWREPATYGSRPTPGEGVDRCRDSAPCHKSSLTASDGTARPADEAGAAEPRARPTPPASRPAAGSTAGVGGVKEVVSRGR